MSKHVINAAVLRDPNYCALERHYLEHPIALYTGAGVSRAEDDRYGLPGWNGFVRQILREHAGPASPVMAQFDEKVSREWAEEPWQMAQWVADRCGHDTFKTLIVEIVRREENFSRKWKQLSGKFLSRAPTLNAVSAFCTQLVGVVEGTAFPTYRVSPNPRVRAVLTSNYDPFLEAASSTMFIQPVLKPVGALGSHVGRLDQIPVFHVHGYVPYPERKEPSRDLKPFVDPVILTEDYEAAWRPTDVFCPTMGPQIHVLRHYATLFIGFSFRDRWVNQLLESLNKEREERSSGDRLYHYALLRRDEVQSKAENFWTNVGVKPIALDDFNEIPQVLGHLYQQALAYDYGESGVELPVVEKRRGKRTGRYITMFPVQYWEDLQSCRNRAIR